ncbi:MAG: hypothetical protein ACYTA5_24385, partial [Planctomycetota bacterium]
RIRNPVQVLFVKYSEPGGDFKPVYADMPTGRWTDFPPMPAKWGLAPLENRAIGFEPHLVILFPMSWMEKAIRYRTSDVGSNRSHL